MPTRFLTESDVAELVDMPECLEIVEQAFRELASGQARNIPRARASMPGAMLHTMSASAEYLGVLGWKAYTSTKQGLRFHVALYSAESGECLSLIQADWLGQLRTGASTGVACRSLLPSGPKTVGLFGTGTQARTQLLAICAATDVEHAFVFGRDESRRAEFARRMAAETGCSVEAASSPTEAARDRDIVVTATTSKTPVVTSEDISASTLVCAIGSNFKRKQEVDTPTVERSRLVVADQIEQCRIEAGELIAAADAGLLNWDEVVELGSLLTRDPPITESENGPGDLLFYKSVGLAVQDVALAHVIYQKAVERGLGIELDL